MSRFATTRNPRRARRGSPSSTRSNGARLAARSILTAIGTLALAATLAACASSPATPVAVSDDTRIIDVRTPAEFAEGHLDGAELLDLSGGEFAAALPSLDPDDEYLVYCRSGNRSAQAVQLMVDAGFSDVTDLGSLGDAAGATGIAIVK